MKLFNRTNVISTIICLVIYILGLISIYYDKKQTDYDMLSNRLYYSDRLVIENSSDIDWATQEFKGDYRIFLEFAPFFRALISDREQYKPPMILGEYPKELETDLKAVIGRDQEDIVTVENGTKVINLFEHSFEVVGIVGEEFITVSDDVILLFGLEFSLEDFEGGVIVIDSKSSKTLERIKTKLLEENPNIKITGGPSKGKARITKSSYFYRLLKAEILILIGLALVLLRNYKYDKFKKLRKTYFILGISVKNIVIYDLAETIILNLILFGATIAINSILGLTDKVSLDYIRNFALSITSFSCVLIVIFLFFEQIKKFMINIGRKGVKQNV